MNILPQTPVPSQKIIEKNGVELWLKREDLVHPKISGNKFWKLFYNVKNYLAGTKNPMLISFGGAFSNHIAALASLGEELGVPALGVIRGEELAGKFNQNPTLAAAHAHGMEFRFVSRAAYRDKDSLATQLRQEFPHALLLPEGGTNAIAVQGIRHMLDDFTKTFSYLCAAVGTGGTIAGISRFAEDGQQVLGFNVVKDENLAQTVFNLSQKTNVKLIDASLGGYGKIPAELVLFINDFHRKYGIPLDPVYTGKLMMKIFELIETEFFPARSRVLVFHTGGLQGIRGANFILGNAGRELINFDKP